jgi:hypothetical protein
MRKHEKANGGQTGITLICSATGRAVNTNPPADIDVTPFRSASVTAKLINSLWDTT